MPTKNRSYANRGMALEDCVRYSIEFYQYKNEAIICKIPTEFIPIRNTRGKVIDVKVERKSTVDFIGQYKGVPVAFEAKNTNTHRISLKAVQPHQEAFLDKWEGIPGAVAFVVVAFNQLQDFYRIPWYFWKAAMEHDRKNRGKKSDVKIMDDKGDWITWSLTGKASFAPTELPDFWRIDASNIYRLRFLDGLTVNNTEIQQINN